MEKHTPNPEVVIAALENPKFKWRTIEGIASETGVAPETIISVIGQNRERVIQSAIPTPTGQALYTTRGHLIKKSTAMERIVGGFKNRVS